jgi:hypothetical protein
MFGFPPSAMRFNGNVRTDARATEHLAHEEKVSRR